MTVKYSSCKYIISLSKKVKNRSSKALIAVYIDIACSCIFVPPLLSGEIIMRSYVKINKQLFMYVNSIRRNENMLKIYWVSPKLVKYVRNPKLRVKCASVGIILRQNH